MLIKQKIPSLPRNLALGTFCELLIVFSAKVNLPYLFYSTACRYCLLHLLKQNCLLKTFLKTLILMTRVSLYLFSQFETEYISVFFCILNIFLDSSKASSFIVFQQGCIQTENGSIQTWAPKKMSPKMKRRKRKLLFSDKYFKSTMSFLVFCSKEHLIELK